MPAQTFTDDLKSHATWSIFTGILTAALGVFLILYPLFTAAITSILFGAVLIVVAVAQFVFALHSHSVGKFFLKIVLGVLYGIAGIVLAFFPLAGVAALTVMLGALLVAVAAVECALAFQLRPVRGWGWYLFNAAASLLMGMLILAGWPVSSFWAIGTLVGVAVLMHGISRVMLAGSMRRGIGIVDSDIRRAA